LIYKYGFYHVDKFMQTMLLTEVLNDLVFKIVRIFEDNAKKGVTNLNYHFIRSELEKNFNATVSEAFCAVEYAANIKRIRHVEHGYFELT